MTNQFPSPRDGPDEPIPVLRLISRLNIGGTAIHTILLTEGMRDSRYRVHLVCGREDPNEGNMLEYASSHGVTPIVIPELGRRINPWRDIVALWRIYRLIRDIRPRIVDTHAAKAGTLGRIAARLTGVPVVVHTFHGHVLRKYFGDFVSWFFTQVERRLSRWTNRVIMVSRQGREELISLGVVEPERIEFVPLGLELEKIESGNNDGQRLRIDWGIPEDAKLVGIVARLVPIKGHHVFLHAAARVLEKRRDVWFAVVGDGELRGELEDLVRHLDLGDRVVFTGFRNDLANVYSALDIVALTSFNEGLPVTIIEAMTAARPVVATDVGGVSELVEEGKTGFLVSEGDSAALADRILRLAGDPELIRCLGEAGRSLARTRFARDRLVRDMLTIYDELLTEGGISSSPPEYEKAE
jgi:glycosyltransferase involved in cell wall biosynthesis